MIELTQAWAGSNEVHSCDPQAKPHGLNNLEKRREIASYRVRLIPSFEISTNRFDRVVFINET